MTTEREAWSLWSERIADRVDHQDTCNTNGGGCSAPFSTRVKLCSVGEQLAAVEEQAHQTWRASRRLQTAVAS